jgi:hypothetical protein
MELLHNSYIFFHSVSKPYTTIFAIRQNLPADFTVIPYISHVDSQVKPKFQSVKLQTFLLGANLNRVHMLL